MKLKNKFIVISMMFMGTPAFAGGTQIGSGTSEIKCRVDFSQFGSDLDADHMDVQIKEKNGNFSAIVNGAITNRNIRVENFKISPLALTVTSPDDDNYDKLNYGELRVAAMRFYRDDPEFGSKFPFSFSLEKVKSVKLYDLTGDSQGNRFGGLVLVESFDKDGQFLGRFVSSMLPGECHDL